MAELYALHRLRLTVAGEPLFSALATALPALSRHRARLAISAGLVTVDELRILEPKHLLPAGEVAVVCDLRHGIKAPLRARLHAEPAPAQKPFTILHQDSSLVVVDKASGILAAPLHTEDGSAPVRGHIPEQLRRVWRKQGRPVRFIGVVHRLDKETSGCLCLALSREAQRLLAIQFSSHAASRTYRCLVTRSPRTDAGIIDSPLGHGRDGKRTTVDDERPGKEAVTHYRVLHRFTHGAELEVRLETGRTHQIRIHLASIGCPVFGDRVYGLPTRAHAPTPLPKAPRLMLHAHVLAFDHPLGGQRVEVVAPIPPVFPEFTKLLR